MSSHHIIREGQEPALIIANGEACAHELLGQLLEWSPLVVVLDGAIHRVMERGIKADVLLGDFDRTSAAAMQAAAYPLEVVHTPDQNKTDLQKAYDFLLARGHRAANVLWATGRRADHAITNITGMVQYRHVLKLTLIDDYSVIYPLPNRFEKWYAAGTPLSLIPVGTVEGIVTENLKYNLFEESLSIGHRTGSSNEALHDGPVKISYATGDLLLMECHD